MKRRNAGLPNGMVLLAICALILLSARPVFPQVLGSCGTPGEEEPVKIEKGGELQNQRMPLPGERAINFELPAVVGDEIKMVKLSDFNGQYRVVCFYPADFTFV